MSHDDEPVPVTFVEVVHCVEPDTLIVGVATTWTAGGGSTGADEKPSRSTSHPTMDPLSVATLFIPFTNGMPDPEFVHCETDIARRFKASMVEPDKETGIVELFTVKRFIGQVDGTAVGVTGSTTPGRPNSAIPNGAPRPPSSVIWCKDS